MESSNFINSFTNEYLYIPKDYIKSNFNYYFNGDYIRIITNQNCTQNYNSTYCNCYDYNFKNNIMSESISCNTSTNLSKISFEKISSDPKYNEYITNQYNQYNFTYILMFIGIILFVTFLTRERSSL